MQSSRHHSPLVWTLAWVTGIVAGLAAVALLHDRLAGSGAPDEGSSAGLARPYRALLGRNMPWIVGVLGPPRSSAAPRRPAGPDAPYWQADTWYYPLDRRRRAALVVRFQRGIARAIEVVYAPR